MLDDWRHFVSQGLSMPRCEGHENKGDQANGDGDDCCDEHLLDVAKAQNALVRRSHFGKVAINKADGSYKSRKHWTHLEPENFWHLQYDLVRGKANL